MELGVKLSNGPILHLGVIFVLNRITNLGRIGAEGILIEVNITLQLKSKWRWLTPQST